MNAGELSDLWDDVIADFLAGGPSVPENLRPWFNGYKGTGRGEVIEAALPEPWLGGLGTHPHAVFLQLNPGLAVDYQLRNGIFADEIRACGRYSAWTATWPYQQVRADVHDPLLVGSGESMPAARFWNGASRFGNVRLRFAQNWFGNPALTLDDMLMFELYPWHSRGLTRGIRTPIEFVNEHIWEPIADTKAHIVFAFGAPWFEMLRRLDVDVEAELDASNGLHSAVASRSLLIGQARRTGTLIVAEKHAGSAGPPRESEVKVMREAVERVTGQ